MHHGGYKKRLFQYTTYNKSVLQIYQFQCVKHSDKCVYGENKGSGNFHCHRCSFLRGSVTLLRFPASCFRTLRRDWELSRICAWTKKKRPHQYTTKAESIKTLWRLCTDDSVENTAGVIKNKEEAVSADPMMVVS